MASGDFGLVQGTLAMLILKALALEPMHGHGISLRLGQISRGVFHVNPGSLFPALRRLERDGLVRGEWRSSDNNRRARYYALTRRGHTALANQTSDWNVQVAAIQRILQASADEL